MSSHSVVSKWVINRLAAAIRPIYTAVSAEAAQAEFEAFASGPWGQKFSTVSAAWRNAWDRVIPFFAFPPAVRQVIYTTNAIENINSQLRKIIKTGGISPAMRLPLSRSGWRCVISR